MKKYDPTSLKWGICDKNDRLIASFDDQKAADTFHATLGSSPQYSGQNLQVINLATGEPVTSRQPQADRVS